MRRGQARETDPVDASEYVLRRIPKHPGNEIWVDCSLSQPIHSNAFRATDKDTDGISLYRELFVDAVTVATHIEKEGGYYVASLRVADMIVLGVTIVPSPMAGDLHGHCIVPEMRWGLNGARRKRYKELRVLLARLAGSRIVYKP